MDTPSSSPMLITPLGAAHKPTSKQTYDYLHAFLDTLPSSTARTQLERLTDAIGVEIGAIAAGEGERREAERLRVKMQRRAEKKRKREEEEQRQMAAELEGEEEDEGAAGLDDGSDDGGDVEYGDLVQDEDESDQDDPTPHGNGKEDDEEEQEAEEEEDE